MTSRVNELSIFTQGKSSEGPWYLERLFINLKVISRLREGQKLYVNNDILGIDDPERNNYVKSLHRWWFSETRDRTLEEVQKIIQEAIDCGRKAVESNDLNNDTGENRNCSRSELNKRLNVRNWEEVRDKELHMGNNVLLTNLISQLSGVTTGIKELEKTYSQDMTLCSKLELELELIERAKEEFENYLSDGF
jgi:hypothetical protein